MAVPSVGEGGLLGAGVWAWAADRWIVHGHW